MPRHIVKRTRPNERKVFKQKTATSWTKSPLILERNRTSEQTYFQCLTRRSFTSKKPHEINACMRIHPRHNPRLNSAAYRIAIWPLCLSVAYITVLLELYYTSNRRHVCIELCHFEGGSGPAPGSVVAHRVTTTTEVPALIVATA